MKKNKITKIKNRNSYHSLTIGTFIIAIVIAINIMPLIANADHLKGTFYTGYFNDSGGSFTRSFNQYVGTGYMSANVQLSGWALDFDSGDHHIDRCQVLISDVTYNKNTGVVSFTVKGAYDDKNDDDNYVWRAWYTILAQTT